MGRWHLRICAVATAAITLAALPAAFLSDARWEAPRVAFTSIVGVTLLCAVGAGVVIFVGWRRQLAEVSLLGSALFAASLLPLVHGLTIPGVLYGANPTVMVAAFLATPAALVIAIPLLLPRSLSTPLARWWRPWTVMAVVLVMVASAGFLMSPWLLPAPTPRSALTLGVASISLVGTAVLAGRQYRLYLIGRRAGSLIAAAGFGYLGLSNLVWLGAAPFTLGWWLAHLADATGVLGAVAGLLLTHRGDVDVVASLAPVVNRDPLIALELGLTPTVHRFVAALAAKDPVTRDHVVRVAELAMRVGTRAGLSSTRLRVLGLGALLHDVGKLNVNHAVLTKSGALTDDEFELVKQHTVWGETLMLTSPLLAPAASLVRWHHERADGRGYPDGIAGDQIPLEAAIVSVCDAWDAMTFDRPYRAGMPAERAFGILADECGAQWDKRAVTLAIAELHASGPVAASTFDHVGTDELERAILHDHDLVCGCLDALPQELRTASAYSGS